MIRRIFFILMAAFFFRLNNIFAKDINEDRFRAIEIDMMLASNEQAADDEMERSIQWQIREQRIDEEIDFLARKKEKGKIFQNFAGRNLFEPGRKKKDSDNLKFLAFQNTRNALKFSFESEAETRKISSSSAPTRRYRLLFEESLETDFKGSIYHPNLLAFDINLENGLSQNREKFQPNLTGKLTNSPLNYFHILTSFLSKKPYAFSLFADKSREVQNREFFERQIINSTRYGGNFGFKNDFIPAGLSFSNSEKTIDRASRASQVFRDDQLSLRLNNDSKFLGETFFDFTQDKFSRIESGATDQKGTSRDFSLLNQKFLSEDERKSLYSALRFYDITGTSENSTLSLDENLNIKHSEYLDSSYTYNFSDKSSAGAKTRDNRVSAALRHRLYESLTSSLNPYYFKSNATGFSRDSYGLSWDEDYLKRLGKIGKLNLGAGVTYSGEKRKSLDSIFSIIDEAYTLTDGTVTLLDKPRVDTQTVVVTNTAGTVTYILDVDYQLNSVGERTQIQRILGGGIANGQDVLVDYQAKSNPSLTYNTLSDNFRIRMDFLDELIGIYYRSSKESYSNVSSEEDVILQTLEVTVTGIDLKYKNASLEFSDEDYKSSLSPYKQRQLKESFFFNPTVKSTLTFQSSQSIVRLVNTQDTQKFFDFVSRYTVGLDRFTRFNAEAGYRWQKGSNIGLNDLTAGSSIEFNFGKSSMNAGYEFKKQLYLGDKLLNHFFSFWLKRVF